MLTKNLATGLSLLCLLLIWCTACPPAPKPSTTETAIDKDEDSTGDCNTIATAKNMTGTDGCQYLLVLRNGKKYNPVKMVNPDFEFRNNQTVKFGYTVLEDMMGICMAEDAMVSVTCIEEVNTAAGQTEVCVKASSPYDIKWLKDLEKKIRPYQISRFAYEGEYAYLLKTKTNQYLYDCYAKLICQVEGKQMNDCVRLVKGLKDEVVIWVVNH